MGSFAKSKVKYAIGITLSSLAVTVFYQNCAKLNVVDLEAPSRALEAERIALGKDEETVVVGTNAVPDLKMFFVVDNSGTMKQNQLNLSQSFGAMFDAGSSESLSKFDTTAILISTAQKSPSISAEKTTLDLIGNQQKNYSASMTTTTDFFSSSIRSALYNFGFLPGDNIGYQLATESNPLKYTFMPAPVLGVNATGNQVSFSSVIRKLASEDSNGLETEFKSRLSVLNSERIPLVLNNGQYVPQNNNVVDAESGLCAIARILRNPNQTIKSGDLLSFTVVSDENDNDPKGLNCIQSMTQYTGNEDLVDGTCAQHETTISYQTTTSTPLPDMCKLNGNQAYNYKLTYPGTPKITTNIQYKAIATAAQYNASYSSVKYTAQSNSYSQLTTNVTYYTQSCVNIVSDGLVIGQKCSINSTPVNGSKVGNYTSDCYGLAKSLNANAVNSAGNTPTCSTSYVATGTACDPNTNANCKITVNYADKTVNNVLGTFDAASCLAQAKTYADYSSSTTPVCTSTPKVVSACSAAEQAAGCSLKTAATYTQKLVTVNGDYTKNATDCFNYAKTLSGNAVSTAADITECSKIETPQNATYTASIKFSDTKAVDGGSTIAVGTADCGAIKSLIIAKAQLASPTIPSSSACAITSIAKASETSVNGSAGDCSTLAANRCATDGLRDCTGTFVAGGSSSATNPVLVYKKVLEDIQCTSKCSDSKLGACEADTSTITVAQYLKNKYGSTATCAASTTEVAATKETKLAQLSADAANICQPTLTGIPTYFTKTKGPYRTSNLEVDYVAGTVKDANGVSAPAKDLVTYIKDRSAELSKGNSIFSALVRRANDPLGQGGSYGADYEKLVTLTNGQIGSVLSNDYSVVLKDLGKVIKANIERTLVLKKMKATQVIKKVSRVNPSTNALEEIDSTQWTQNGANLVFSGSIDLNDGDQFKVEFQNY